MPRRHWSCSLLRLMLLLACVAPKRSRTETRRLDVRIAPVPGDSGLPFRLYRQLQLRCDVTSHPALDAAGIHGTGWSYEDNPRPLATSHRYTVYREPTGGSSTSFYSLLTINGVTEAELGTYTCRARNAAGMQAQASVTLGEGIDQLVKVVKINPVTTEIPGSARSVEGQTTASGMTVSSTDGTNVSLSANQTRAGTITHSISKPAVLGLVLCALCMRMAQW